MILRKACNLFRDVVVEMTKQEKVLKPNTAKMTKSIEYIDPFQHITLASMCMSIYKHMFLQPESIAGPL